MVNWCRAALRGVSGYFIFENRIAVDKRHSTDMKLDKISQLFILILLMLLLYSENFRAIAAAESNCPDALNGYRVLLDIGHTPKRFGALSARGRPEYQFNRNFVLLLQSLLEASDAQVSIANLSGREITLKKRSDVIRESSPDVFLSIHHDSAQELYFREWLFESVRYRYSDRYEGYSIFVSGEASSYQRSLIFGRLLGDALSQAGFSPTFHHAEDIAGERKPLVDARVGVYRNDELAVLRHNEFPSALVEVGVIVNRNQELKLLDEKYISQFASELINGICNFALLEKRDEPINSKQTQ